MPRGYLGCRIFIHLLNSHCYTREELKALMVGDYKLAPMVASFLVMEQYRNHVVDALKV